jgi:hypothetical protein
VSKSFFPLMVVFWTSFWLVMSEVSIPYFGICFLEHNGAAMSHPQWQYISKGHYLHHDSDSIGLGRLSNGCACALLWVVLEAILHKLYETQVSRGWCYEQNHGWRTNNVLLHWLFCSMLLMVFNSLSFASLVSGCAVCLGGNIWQFMSIWVTRIPVYYICLCGLSVCWKI